MPIETVVSPFEAAADFACANAPLSVRRSLEVDEDDPTSTTSLHRRLCLTERGAFTDPDLALAGRVAEAFGLPFDEAALGPDADVWSATRGPCPLPGHDGIARLLETRAQGERGGRELRFSCACFASERHDGGRLDYHRHLADAYHALKTGRVLTWGGTLPKDQRAYWLAVLARDMGDLAPVELPPVADDSPELLRRAREHFALVSGRERARTGSPVVRWARTMVSRDLGISEREARNLIASMLDAGLIEFDHADPDVIAADGHRLRRGAHYYRPGRVRVS